MLNNKESRWILIIGIVFIIVSVLVYFVFFTGPSTEPDEVVQEVETELVAEGFTAPVELVSPGDGTGRMFIVSQDGLISVINSDGEVLEESFLDLSDEIVELDLNYDERGLLGLAFHPNFEENGRFFVYYSAPLRDGAPENWDHTSVVSEFEVKKDDPNSADPNSEEIILQVDQPQLNHNGGSITFGPEGFLYIPLGDGGAANDVGLGHPDIGNGQDKSTLLGSILRIDIDQGNPYSVPNDNPFVDEEGQDQGRDEIFAYGFRNPYHISFDTKGENKLFVSDVGQNLWEEVDIVKKGGNYGWNIKEGMHCFDPENPNQPSEECPDVGADGEPLIDPILEYKNANNGGIGLAIIGGYVYRGEAIDNLGGDYVFGDWSNSWGEGNGTVFAANLVDGEWQYRELEISNKVNNRLGSYLLGIGQNTDNELYLLTSEKAGPTGETGKVLKIVPS